MIETTIYILVAIMFMVLVINKYIENKNKLLLISIPLQLVGIIIGVQGWMREETPLHLMILKYVLGIILPIILIGKSKQNKKSSKDLIEKIEGLIEEKELKTAKEMLLQMQEQNNENPYIHKLLAKIYEMEEKSVRAIEESIMAIRKNDKDFDSYLVAAKNAEKINRKEEAKIFIKDALNKNPNMLEGIDMLR